MIRSDLIKDVGIGLQRRPASSHTSEAEGTTVSFAVVLFPSTPIAVAKFLPGVNKRLGVKEDHTASWFNHDNREANSSREKLAHDSLEMLIQWLKEGGNVGIHGASALFIILWLRMALEGVVI